MAIFFPTSYPELKNESFTVKGMTAENSADFLKLRTNPDVMRYIDRPAIYTESEAKAMIERGNLLFKEQQMLSMGIFVEEGKKLIGTVGFYRMDLPNYRAEIGYMLLPNYWRKGIVSAAITSLLNYGFDEMQLHSVEANINPANVASRAILKKFGFQKEAYFRENYYFNGRFIDSEIYCLLKSEWK